MHNPVYHVISPVLISRNSARNVHEQYDKIQAGFLNILIWFWEIAVGSSIMYQVRRRKNDLTKILRCSKFILKDRQNCFKVLFLFTMLCIVIFESCCLYATSIFIISLLVYFSKGRYPWFEFLVQSFRTSDYQFGGFYWKHEPDRFRMKIWIADNNLHIPDISYFWWVDRWEGSNMMMTRSSAKV